MDLRIIKTFMEYLNDMRLVLIVHALSLNKIVLSTAIELSLRPTNYNNSTNLGTKDRILCISRVLPHASLSGISLWLISVVIYWSLNAN